MRVGRTASAGLLQATQKLHFKLNQLIDINWLAILLNEFSCAVPVSRNFLPSIAICKQVIIKRALVYSNMSTANSERQRHQQYRLHLIEIVGIGIGGCVDADAQRANNISTPAAVLN